jgi:hypothetical protein
LTECLFELEATFYEQTGLAAASSDKQLTMSKTALPAAKAAQRGEMVENNKVWN